MIKANELVATLYLKPGALNEYILTIGVICKQSVY